MTFPSAFGSQLAAIMDVLAKAAVAEISKLVEDGTVVLRLEMCRRDSEIQELKRSLKLMEVELCKAREAAETRTTEQEEQEQTVGTQVPSKDEREDAQTNEGYLGSKTPVKHEPAVGLVMTETNVCFEAGERSDSVWPPAACSRFEKSSVAMQQQQQQQQQQHLQMFPSHGEQLSYSSPPTAAQEIADDSLSVPIKVETEIEPVCTGGTTSQSVSDEPFRLVSCPTVSENQRAQPRPQQAGRSPAVPHVQRSAAVPEDHTLSRNHLRAKRLMNMWRANQKLFICSVCNKGFPRLSQLEEHKATHQLFKPFRCLECGKSFTQKTRLKTHQSVHTGERPFSCKICGKMFSRQDNCTRHERFHSGLKPYSCGQCGKSFTVLGNLKIHQEIHMQGR